MLESEELETILENIKQKIYSLNSCNELETFLDKIGISYTSKKEKNAINENITTNPNGKIVIIGDSKMKINHLAGMLKDKFGMTNDSIRKRFEVVFEYEGLNHYNFDKLSKYDYAVILMGPAPHNVTGKGDASSLITMLENNKDDFYPPVYRLSQKDPISKSSVEIALSKLKEDGTIVLN